MIYFTSDTHFGHKNIISYCNRPYNNVDEMDKALIENWNNTVKPQDQVYHLGDVSFRDKQRTNNILKQLNGQKFLIRGNHDDGLKGDILKNFGWVKDYYSFKLRNPRIQIVLFHYPIDEWHGKYRGSVHLHGHSHGNVRSRGTEFRMDVGVDLCYFKPISIDSVLSIMETKRLERIKNEASFGVYQ